MKIILIILPILLISCESMKKTLIKNIGGSYEAQGDPSNLKPNYLDKDQNREKINISLTDVAKANMPTDIAFAPGINNAVFILEKEGKLLLINLENREQHVLLELPVLSNSEQGLLGIAFHPEFKQNRLFYLNYTLEKGDSEVSRVSEWKLDNINKNLDKLTASNERIVLEVKQPYANHNAGQLAFGPDKMLYIGLGDGGWKDDPLGHGQNPGTLLGKMLRINVNGREKGGYSIPPDNPFVDRKDYKPEIFALGLRNPWRYSFSKQGHLVVSDVGQNKFEEINIVRSGKNYGWNKTEGISCFLNDICDQAKYEPPIYQYGRDEGRSITGGFVYNGQRLDKLKDTFIFGDFVTGRLWAIPIPELPIKSSISLAKVNKVFTLGKWPLLPSTFGMDNQGELYLADYGSGKIYRIDPS
jgi:glucose/arabinose dehydrogenase